MDTRFIIINCIYVCLASSVVGLIFKAKWQTLTTGGFIMLACFTSYIIGGLTFNGALIYFGI